MNGNCFYRCLLKLPLNFHELYLLIDEYSTITTLHFYVILLVTSFTNIQYWLIFVGVEVCVRFILDIFIFPILIKRLLSHRLRMIFEATDRLTGLVKTENELSFNIGQLYRRLLLLSIIFATLTIPIISILFIILPEYWMKLQNDDHLIILNKTNSIKLTPSDLEMQIDYSHFSPLLITTNPTTRQSNSPSFQLLTTTTLETTTKSNENEKKIDNYFFKQNLLQTTTTTTTTTTTSTSTSRIRTTSVTTRGKLFVEGEEVMEKPVEKFPSYDDSSSKSLLSKMSDEKLRELYALIKDGKLLQLNHKHHSHHPSYYGSTDEENEEENNKFNYLSTNRRRRSTQHVLMKRNISQYLSFFEKKFSKLKSEMIASLSNISTVNQSITTKLKKKFRNQFLVKRFLPKTEQIILSFIVLYEFFSILRKNINRRLNLLMEKRYYFNESTFIFKQNINILLVNLFTFIPLIISMRFFNFNVNRLIELNGLCFILILLIQILSLSIFYRNSRKRSSQFFLLFQKMKKKQDQPKGYHRLENDYSRCDKLSDDNFSNSEISSLNSDFENMLPQQNRNNDDEDFLFDKSPTHLMRRTEIDEYVEDIRKFFMNFFQNSYLEIFEKRNQLFSDSQNFLLLFLMATFIFFNSIYVVGVPLQYYTYLHHMDMTLTHQFTNMIIFVLLINLSSVVQQFLFFKLPLLFCCCDTGRHIGLIENNRTKFPTMWQVYQRGKHFRQHFQMNYRQIRCRCTQYLFLLYLGASFILKQIVYNHQNGENIGKFFYITLVVETLFSPLQNFIFILLVAHQLHYVTGESLQLPHFVNWLMNCWYNVFLFLGCFFWYFKFDHNISSPKAINYNFLQTKNFLPNLHLLPPITVSTIIIFYIFADICLFRSTNEATGKKLSKENEKFQTKGKRKTYEEIQLPSMDEMGKKYNNMQNSWLDD
ncbi:hypothetical protein SNEBB_005741 [Seison nebaliae]|nr:hypothetical protein SNEBB_005741 [Seison nebaliae]